MNELTKYAAIIVCLVGLLIYLLAFRPTDAHPRVSEIGRIMFAFGLLAALLGK